MTTERVDEDCEHENRLLEFQPFEDIWKNWQDDDVDSLHTELDDYYLAQVVTMMTLFPCKEVDISGKNSLLAIHNMKDKK